MTVIGTKSESIPLRIIAMADIVIIDGVVVKNSYGYGSVI